MKNKKLKFKLFHSIAKFLDEILIKPISRLIIAVNDLIKSNTKRFDKITNNKASLIIISLILAFATFLIIDRESTILIDQYAEILYDQKVRAEYNEELYVVEGLPKKVDITMIGEKRHIFLAEQAPATDVTVDLTGLKPGNHKVALKYAAKIKSLNYKIDPSEVTITIYKKESDTKNVSTELMHQDSLDSKLYISNVNLERTNVIIKSAKKRLEKVAAVKALIDVSKIPNASEGTQTIENIPLVAYDENGKSVDVEIVPEKVKAEIKIVSPSKKVPITVVPSGSLAFGKAIKSITTNINEVTVYGDQNVIDKINELEVKIDVKGLENNKEYNVSLEKPAGITDISETNIKVNVEVSNSITKEFNNISVRTINLDSKYKVQALSEADREVTVIVKGVDDIINQIDSTSINAYIDLSNYGVGDHVIDVQVEGNDNRLTYSSKTKSVQVRISEK